MRPKRESSARLTKPPTSICVRRNTSLQTLPIEKQYSSCCRSCATASNLEHRRRSRRNLAAATARAPHAAAARRRAIRVAVATRAHHQAAGLGAAFVIHSAFRSAGWAHRTCGLRLGRGIRGPLASSSDGLLSSRACCDTTQLRPWTSDCPPVGAPFLLRVRGFSRNPKPKTDRGLRFPVV